MKRGHGGSPSEAIRRRLHRIIPAGCHTYSKGDESFPRQAPPVIARGKGAWVWDVEGRRFLDLGMGLRSVILGHADPSVLAAVRSWLARGANHTRPTELEAELAETLVRLIPCAEMVKFSKNGSNATTAAVKLARAVTGRPLVALCAEHPFFSFDDWFIGTTVCPAGVPAEVQRLSRIFHYNDLDSLRRLFRKNRNRIACVIMEVATTDRMPEPGFLAGVRAECDRNGALLIFDEMITGFRWHIKGAAHQFGVRPDLAAFGKGMGNGFSVSALVGRRDVMRWGGDPAAPGRVFLLSSTHGAETHSLAAALATIRAIESRKGPARLKQEGEKWIREGNRVLLEEGIASRVRLFGHPSSPLFETCDENGARSLAYLTLLLQELAKAGVLCLAGISLSLVHGERERKFFLRALRVAAGRYRSALEEGVTRHLEGPVLRPVFRQEP